MSEWIGHEPYIVNSEEYIKSAEREALINDDCGYPSKPVKNESQVITDEVPIEVKILCNETCRKQMEYYEDTIVRLNDVNRHLRDKVTLYTVLTYFFVLTTGLPLLYMLVEYCTTKGLM